MMGGMAVGVRRVVGLVCVLVALVGAGARWASPVAAAVSAVSVQEGPCGPNPCGSVPPDEGPCGPTPCPSVVPTGPCGANPCDSVPVDVVDPCAGGSCDSQPPAEGPCGANPCPETATDETPCDSCGTATPVDGTDGAGTSGPTTTTGSGAVGAGVAGPGASVPAAAAGNGSSAQVAEGSTGDGRGVGRGRRRGRGWGPGRRLPRAGGGGGPGRDRRLPPPGARPPDLSPVRPSRAGAALLPAAGGSPLPARLGIRRLRGRVLGRGAGARPCHRPSCDQRSRPGWRWWPSSWGARGASANPSPEDDGGRLSSWPRSASLSC